MKLFKLFLIAVAAVFAWNNKVVSQQDAQFTMYMFNPLVSNPSIAGTRDALSVTLLARKQWVGVDGAPETGTLTVHSPLKNENFSLGLSALYDKIGPSNTTSVYGDFAYKLQVSRTSRLSMGLRAGTDIISVCYSCLTATQKSDQLASSNIQNKPYFNAGIGFYWYSPSFYVGVSSPKVIENLFTNISGGKQIRHYQLAAGKTFKLSSATEVLPSLIVKAAQNTPLAVDVNVNFLFYEKVWIGGGYRFGDAVVFNLMYHFSPVFRAGYALDRTVSKLSGFNSGSHEIMINYDLDFLGKGFPTPRRF